MKDVIFGKEVKQEIKGMFYEAFEAVRRDIDALPLGKISRLYLKLYENDEITLEIYNLMRKWLELDEVQAIPENINNEMED